MIKDDIKKTLK